MPGSEDVKGVKYDTKVSNAPPVRSRDACLLVVCAISALRRRRTSSSRVDIYKELVEINTVDSVGSVTKAAEAMAARFRAAGFPDSDVKVLIPDGKPTKGNLVVRYHGRGGANAGKPLLLLAHLDVVEALKTDWSPDLDPFKFLERDGYYYGRGTSDDKAMASIFVANIVRLKREGYVPDRDIIIALTADEEGGCCNGARWLATNHRDSWTPPT